MVSLSFHLITAPLPLFPRPPRPVHLIKFRFHTVDSQISANLLITSTSNPPQPNPSRAIFIKKKEGKVSAQANRRIFTQESKAAPPGGSKERAAQREKIFSSIDRLSTLLLTLCCCRPCDRQDRGPPPQMSHSTQADVGMPLTDCRWPPSGH